MALYDDYRRIKKNYPDSIILIRVGDFFEAYDDDATTVAGVCGTGRYTRRVKNHAVPLTGFSYVYADSYVKQLVAAGHKVALAEYSLETDKVNAAED